MVLVFFLLRKENDWYSWPIFKKLLFYVIKYNIEIELREY